MGIEIKEFLLSNYFMFFCPRADSLFDDIQAVLRFNFKIPANNHSVYPNHRDFKSNHTREQ